MGASLMSEVEREKKSLLPLSQSRYSDPLKTRERKGDGRLVAMRVPAAFALRAHRSSSVQECQSGSPKCVWQNQRLHRSQYLVATIMHGSSQGEMPWQNTPLGVLSPLPGVSRPLM
jgi:hypothetical protein